jgi:hypothetical protein
MFSSDATQNTPSIHRLKMKWKWDSDRSFSVETLQRGTNCFYVEIRTNEVAAKFMLSAAWNETWTQSDCLDIQYVTGDRHVLTGFVSFPCASHEGMRGSTPTSHLHNSLNVQPIPVLIHRLTDKFFAHCPSHPNPLVQQIGNYALADLTNLYKKYKHKRSKHLLL